jgi:hypothetical protein
MSAGFIKFIRSDDAAELLKHPNELALLALIALRARRRCSSFAAVELQPGEALVGDYAACGISRQSYRTALSRLEKWGFLAIRPTTKGTVAKIIKSTVFDINADESNHQINQQPTINQPTANHQPTTNEEGKEGKKVKNTSCAKPETGPAPPPVLAIPLVGGKNGKGPPEFPVYPADIAEWSAAFPAVDVPQALRAIRQWNLSHPTRRKTHRGIRGHITQWLTREQDRGGCRPRAADAPSGCTSAPRALTAAEIEEETRAN